MTTYEELGIKPVINACGKMTLLGASVLDKRVAEAMVKASRYNVSMPALEDKAGEKIAEYTGAEAACVTAGAAAGIAISAAAFLSGTNIAKAQALPGDPGEKNELVIQIGHLINFAGLAKLSGAQLVPIGWINGILKEHLAEAINEKTAGFIYIVSHHTVQKGMLKLEDCISICHAKDVPVLVDAAAEEDLEKYISLGADLVTYSGGKAIEGPSFGFICGKKKYVEACRLQEWGIARPMKVTKEGILGLLTALEIYTQTEIDEKRSHEAVINQSILENLQDLPGIDVRIVADEVRESLRRVQIKFPESYTEKSVYDLIDFLRSGETPIVTRDHKANLGIIAIDPRSLSPDQAAIIIQRMRQFFGK